jgi:hypothetical protein
VSRSLTDAPRMATHGTASVGAWRASLVQRWQALRGGAPRHAVFVHTEGVVAWPAGRAASGSDAAMPERFDSFEAWCGAHAGEAAQLHLSGRLVHNLLIEPSLGLRGPAATLAYARQQFTHYHGAAAQQWPLAVALAGGGSVVCALHSLELGQLRSSAQRHGVRLLGAAPVWAAGLSSLARREPEFTQPGRRALAVVEGTLVTWLASDGGRIVALQQRRLDTPHLDELAELIDALASGSEPLVATPFVVGWGLQSGDHAERAARVPARLLSLLGEEGGLRHWVLDRVDAPTR